MLLVLLISAIGHSRAQVQEQIDSLALIDDPEREMWMALSVAKELKTEDWSRTIHFLTIAERAAKESKNAALWYDFNFEAGGLYQEKGLNDIAIDHYLTGYDSYDPDKSRNELYKLDNNLGILYARRKNVNKTLFYFNRVLEHEGLNLVSRGQILNNMGNFLVNNHLPDSAIYYLDQAQDIATSLDDLEFLSFIFTNKGRAYAALPDKGMAIQMFSKAIALCQDSLTERSKSWVYVSASSFYADSQYPDSAIKYGLRALDVLQNRPRADYIKDAAHSLYRAYLDQGKYKAASAYFEKYDSARVEIQSMEAEISMDRLQLAQEFQEQIRVRDLEESKRKFRLIIVGLGILIAVILMGALLLRYRAKLQQAKLAGELAESRRKELKSKLELREKELVSGTMQELAKSTFLTGLSDQLKQIKLNATKKETRTEIDRVIAQIKRDMKTDIWKEFDTHFTEIHESFYRELNENHSDLTSRDIRLCALLRLNLSTKEIADLTGQSIKGIENARVRIRKKLNLTNTGSELSGYLNSIGR